MKSEIRYIDPDKCGSFVGYRVELPEFRPSKREGRKGFILGGSIEVDLADCNRTVSWTLTTNQAGLDKLAEAKLMLNRATVALEDMIKHRKDIEERFKDQVDPNHFYMD